jgi:hypothetical protein
VSAVLIWVIIGFTAVDDHKLSAGAHIYGEPFRTNPLVFMAPVTLVVVGCIGVYPTQIVV